MFGVHQRVELAASHMVAAPVQLGVDLNAAVSQFTRYVDIAVPNDARFVGTMLSIQGASLGTGYPCCGGQVRYSDTVDVRIQ